MTSNANQTASAPAEFSSCTRCAMRVRTTELWAHTAHAHNVDLDAKKPKGRGKGRDRGRR